MGKGDVKTKRGKIWKGSFGNSRPRKSHSIPVIAEVKVKVVKPKAPSKAKKS